MQLIILLFSAVVHEVFHGLAALWRGDPTAKKMGRLTLNPLPHIDPFMSVLLPVFLVITGSPFIFAAAKPVPVNPYNLKNPERDMAVVAAAGPFSNISMAVLAGILFRVLYVIFSGQGIALGGFEKFFVLLFSILQIFVLINIMLALVNLLPIPPLDGSKVLSYFMSPKIRERYLSLNGFVGIALLMLVFVFFRKPFYHVIQFLASTVLGL
ncbi:site-2 protease family protein [candidate division WOR-3 bacterium]|nr:site-2 protease family protein [candidate division WOR-3 bacterium]